MLDNGGGAGVGAATALHCTNFSGVPETVRIVVRDSNASLAANFAFGLGHLQTRTFTTHAVTLYAQNTLGTGVVLQGTAAIAATSINVICTAVTLDASAAIPTGFALRGIRFNPAPGSQE